MVSEFGEGFPNVIALWLVGPRSSQIMWVIVGDWQFGF